MTDLHSHILPGIDDGAKDVETSVKLLKIEQEQGVKTIVFTPHYYGKTRSPEEFLQARTQAYESIKTQIPDGIDVRLGAEVYFSGSRIPYAQSLQPLAIEGTDYILLEFPCTRGWGKYLLKYLERFIDETGLTPIIAHVERYEEIRRKPKLLTELIHLGCLLQVNVSAFLHKEDKKFAFAMLKKGYVHCLASDAHNLDSRLPEFTAAKKVFNEEKQRLAWEIAQENMRLILGNQPVYASYEKPIKKFLTFYY